MNDLAKPNSFTSLICLHVRVDVIPHFVYALQNKKDQDINSCKVICSVNMNFWETDFYFYFSFTAQSS